MDIDDLCRAPKFKSQLIYKFLNEVDKLNEYDFKDVNEFIILDEGCNKDVAVLFYFELLNIALTSNRLSDKAKIYYSIRLSKLIYLRIYE
ncbi:hypothetical protein PX74_003761 [Salmonella enterica subsp. enterica]|nr:hypothetical protein [Salmonella enterica subsp. enterica]